MKTDKNYDIFISYRRDGGEVTARILRDSLTERGYKVFFDVESLRSGSFNTKLYSVIEECNDFILVLSPNALDRCKNDGDWVRQEIEHALKKGKNIIPILLRNFEFPTDLPDTLKELPYQSGLTANLEYYDAFLTKLEEFLTTRKSFRQSILDFMRSAKIIPILLCATAILAGAILFSGWLQKYPRTAEQINLTESVVANVSYNLSCMDILAGVQEDMLQAAQDCLITGEDDICASRFAVCRNTIEELDLSSAEPGDSLLIWMQDSPFGAEDLKAMHQMLRMFHKECETTMAYMEYLVSDECMLSDSEKLETIMLYTSYLEETVEWFAYCTNEMLLPITHESHLAVFWTETLPYLGAIPLNAKNWSRDKETLIEAGNECYENMQQIQADLSSILGNTTMDLRAEQAQIRHDLTKAGYTEARAKKIVSYMSRDWKTELIQSYIRQGYSEETASSLAQEESARRDWELEVILTFSGRSSDDVNTLWEKITYLLDHAFYEEAEECIVLYQAGMDNSDRYLPGLILYMQLLQSEQLDYGIMVMDYYPEDGINPQLMIGDIIYRFNGNPCETTRDYIAAKEALTSDNYTVQVLRVDENNKIQSLELTLSTGDPRVYLNDLTVPNDK